MHAAAPKIPLLAALPTAVGCCCCCCCCCWSCCCLLMRLPFLPLAHLETALPCCGCRCLKGPPFSPVLSRVSTIPPTPIIFHSPCLVSFPCSCCSCLLLAPSNSPSSTCPLSCVNPLPLCVPFSRVWSSVQRCCLHKAQTCTTHARTHTYTHTHTHTHTSKHESLFCRDRECARQRHKTDSISPTEERQRHTMFHRQKRDRQCFTKIDRQTESVSLTEKNKDRQC